MHYLITLTILIISEVLYCSLLIGTDSRIIGHINMTGAPVSQMDVVMLAAGMSLVVFSIVAGIYVFLKKQLTRTFSKFFSILSLKYILPLMYVLSWLCVALEVASFYSDMFGATWVDLEFFFFYFLNLKAILLGTIIVTSAHTLNLWLFNRCREK